MSALEDHLMQLIIIMENYVQVPIYHNIVRSSSTNERPKLLAWRRPILHGYIAVNCDGSYWDWKSIGGCGIIIRDYFGNLILAKASRFRKSAGDVKYETIVLMIEMRAILNGLRLAKALCNKYVEIQSDSRNAISIVVGQAECPKECLDIYYDILSEITFFKGLGFIFVYRERNGAADFLSRCMEDNGEEYFRPSRLPPQLRETIAKDALCSSTARSIESSPILRVKSLSTQTARPWLARKPVTERNVLV